MASFVVPVIDVHNDNFKELWPAMVVALKTSSFIALDTELSGLGNRKSLLAESIEDRYKAICHAARSRSILSLGFASFKKLDNKPADSYLVQVYNLTLLCSEEYIIEPQSVQFLVQHGFDFNKQYAHGIPYLKGNNKAGSDYHGVHIRALFTELLRARKPLVLHNGLIDMAFLYQSFYAHLPDQLATFTADLSEMFSAVFMIPNIKLDNSRGLTSGTDGPHVHVEFCQYGGHMSSYVDFRECPDVTSTEGQTEICERFSAFGWCPNGTQCLLSHDTDLILLQDEKNKDDKRKKRKQWRWQEKGENTEDSPIFEDTPENKMLHIETDVQKPDINETDENMSSVTTGELPITETNNGVQSMKKDVIKKSPIRSPQKKKMDTGTHRAGFDAFMTGYIFAHACATDKKTEDLVAGSQTMANHETQKWLPSNLNKVYLSGKSVPLNIVKSAFAKSSRAHALKMETLWDST
ncbi:hypothetical protein WMY93_001130 [Mugilogobius chulae]|uniref:Target of EGR1 protein 1 n=1 Tax=Mugilogobius chulae TaxID=88201 RepID=A0AAW0QBW5_9GOBI